MTTLLRERSVGSLYTLPELDALFNDDPLTCSQGVRPVTITMTEQITERHMLTLLYARHSVDPGNGPRYVCAEHVRSEAGFGEAAFGRPGDRLRTCDFMALDVWPSSGMPLHGFEVKVSRSDWLRELKEPEKSAPFMRIVDHWWLVAAPGVARVSELPPGWGMMEVVEKERAVPTLFDDEPGSERVLGLKMRRSAPRLPNDGVLSRGFTVALMRAGQKTGRRYG